jgi:DNA ligase-1
MDVQLAKEYIHGAPGPRKDTTKYKDPPLQWIMSEKFDGYRALFNYDESGNGVFTSRSGNTFNAPDWFLRAMPPPALLGSHILDGELWAGRDNFQMMGVVRKKVPLEEEWMPISYQVYDITNYQDTFVNRLQILQNIVSACQTRWRPLRKSLGYPYQSLESPLVFATQIQIKSMNQMKSMYEDIISKGGEGIMMKHPSHPYEHGRSSYLLKYKPVYDREAIIVDYKMGKGKYVSKLGAFVCQPLINHDTYSVIDPDKTHQFTLSGMDDEIRSDYQETHPVGTIISYECSGYTDKGVPRFGRYVRVRDDLEIRDCEGSNEGVMRVSTIMNALEHHWRIQGDTFRLTSYRRAAQCLQKIHNDTQLLDGTFASMDGIGPGTLSKVREILETGTCAAYEKVKQSIDSVSAKEEFLKIHGVGRVHAQKLVDAGFTSIQELRESDALDDHLNDVQKNGLRYVDEMQMRIPFQEIQHHEIFLKQILHKVDPNGDLTVAGSYRRQKPDSGDIDVLITGATKKTYETFIESLTDCGYLQCCLAKGPKKYMGMGLLSGSGVPEYNVSEYNVSEYNVSRRIDIMYTKPTEYPFAILYFTGSMEFNQRMRQDQVSKGLTLNEYSLRHNDTKRCVDHVFHTEQDIFEYMGYEYVEPQDRV